MYVFKARKSVKGFSRKTYKKILEEIEFQNSIHDCAGCRKVLG